MHRISSWSLLTDFDYDCRLKLLEITVGETATPLVAYKEKPRERCYESPSNIRYIKRVIVNFPAGITRIYGAASAP